MKLKVNKSVFNDIYYPYLWDNSRYLHFYGGSGSGKSVFVGQKLILESFKTKNDFLCVRKVETTLKESVYKLLKETIFSWKLQDYFEFKVAPLEITNTVTKCKFVFKGLDDPEKIKSITGIQKVWFEEATEGNKDDYNELDRRLRGLENLQIIFSYNPIDENHDLKKYYHNNPPENCKIIKSTYLDNKFIDKEYKATLDRLKETDENQWRIYALGEWGVQNLRHKFDIRKVMQIETKEPLQVIDGVKIYRLPKAGQIYSLGIDPSSGLGDDWTCLTLRGFYPDEKGKHNLYAQMKAKIGERETARIAINLANLYNRQGKVLMVPEVNGLGRAVVNYIIDDYNNDLIYKRYIQDATKQYDTLIPDFGFQTNKNTRDLIINKFNYCFVDNKLEILNQEEVDEMKTFIYKQNEKDVNKGRYEAQEGANDDLLFSDFLCLTGFDYIRHYL